MTFVAHLDGSPGVLARVEGLFRRQNLQLTSLTLSESAGSTYVVMVEAPAEGETGALLLKHFRRLADVRHVAVVPKAELA